MLQDVGHKLCPSPILGDKKGTKTKKQMAASEEYQTMLSLFNKGIITMASPLTVREVFRDHFAALGTNAMMIRMCDENSGFFSFVFGLEEGHIAVATFGSLPAFLSLLQQQITVPATTFTTAPRGGFDIRTLLRNMQLPEKAQ
ncbi:hypothetical protein NECAME_17131 [Necator americanus]|uniref:Uncharacterized protein n=1 Tax=Necator americanus TaxID=51031 RepID=W2TTW7_NECAM|nr:hypothetical protein NECAME_17131 [Necator americanus]ETN84497.1 hypothetical protein NECAME_17131 [Necator americanus]